MWPPDRGSPACGPGRRRWARRSGTRSRRPAWGSPTTAGSSARTRCASPCTARPGRRPRPRWTAPRPAVPTWRRPRCPRQRQIRAGQELGPDHPAAVVAFGSPAGRQPGQPGEPVLGPGGGPGSVRGGDGTVLVEGLLAPPSDTATRTVCPVQVTSVAKKPSWPVAVCRIALAASSAAQRAMPSPSGWLPSNWATNEAASVIWSSWPGKTLHHLMTRDMQAGSYSGDNTDSRDRPGPGHRAAAPRAGQPAGDVRSAVLTQLVQTWTSETCPAGHPVLAVKFSRTYR